MSHTMKLCGRVVEASLQSELNICDQQYIFMQRESTTDAIFSRAQPILSADMGVVEIICKI